MANGSIQNYRSLFNYVRKHIDRKALFNEPYAEPVPIPEDYYFHLGDDQFFATYEGVPEILRGIRTLQGGSTPCGAAFGQHQHAKLQRGAHGRHHQFPRRTRAERLSHQLVRDEEARHDTGGSPRRHHQPPPRPARHGRRRKRYADAPGTQRAHPRTSHRQRPVRELADRQAGEWHRAA